jgi:uncharacterized membrane protein YqaE (UPF0057 family)
MVKVQLVLLGLILPFLAVLIKKEVCAYKHSVLLCFN